MENMEQIMGEVLSQLKERGQNASSLVTSLNQGKQKKSCPFKLCDGSGILWTMKEGRLYAKNCRCTEKVIEEARLEKALRFAHIPEAFRAIKVNDFDCQLYDSRENRCLAAAARKMTKNYILTYPSFEAAGKGLYFYSQERGSGKTMLALALGNALIQLYHKQVRFMTTPDLLSAIRKTYDKASSVQESELIDSLKQVEVLILDDIGTEKQSGWTSEILYQILNTRLAMKLVTLFTSNVHLSQLQQDSRIISRIEKLALPVQMPEESIRSKLAQQENEGMIKKLLADEGSAAKI